MPWEQLVGVLSTDDALHDACDAAEAADRQPQVSLLAACKPHTCLLQPTLTAILQATHVRLQLDGESDVEWRSHCLAGK